MLWAEGLKVLDSLRNKSFGKLILATRQIV